MASNDEPFAHPRQTAWATEDVVFAANELAREFSEAATELILAAVKSAPFLPSAAGRV